jgi:hypothetical protein
MRALALPHPLGHSIPPRVFLLPLWCVRMRILWLNLHTFMISKTELFLCLLALVASFLQSTVQLYHPLFSRGIFFNILIHKVCLVSLEKNLEINSLQFCELQISSHAWTFLWIASIVFSKHPWPQGRLRTFYLYYRSI